MAWVSKWAHDDELRPLLSHTTKLATGLALFSILKPIYWLSFLLSDVLRSPTPQLVKQILEGADDFMLVYFVLILCIRFVQETWPFGRGRGGAGMFALVIFARIV